ncbi:MAG: hypothetical protein ACKON7_04125 [Planctomycetaceae bacterium]
MAHTTRNQVARAAILALAETKAAADAFDRGETNVHDALDAIIVAIEAYQAAARRAPRGKAA